MYLFEDPGTCSRRGGNLKRKKRLPSVRVGAKFSDLYQLTGEYLGQGSCGKVESCVNIFTGMQYAVKLVKIWGGEDRKKILKEIEVYYICRGHPNVVQLIEYFEEDNMFFLIFEKVTGGSLLDQIRRRTFIPEAEASLVIRDLASALSHIHSRGIAHRDIKPDNVLCVSKTSPNPVKLCDFDLCSPPIPSSSNPCSPSLQSPVGTLEYLAPEVVDTFVWEEQDDEISYDKKCDLWSLGVLMYILLCGYPPFSGHCGVQCGWDRGEYCKDCQDSLFSSIKEDRVAFPNRHWANISHQAKDLIQSLLVKDSSSRIEVDQVLSHPWVVGESNNNKEHNTTARNNPISSINSSKETVRNMTAPIDIPGGKRTKTRTTGLSPRITELKGGPPLKSYSPMFDQDISRDHGTTPSLTAPPYLLTSPMTPVFFSPPPVTSTPVKRMSVISDINNTLWPIGEVMPI